ncbi:MAG TPA: tetratricopeptide repeat protein [Terriglobales bacterium]|nr:tetratricopeptide repeat protein [Terriglobales bacterium]
MGLSNQGTLSGRCGRSALWCALIVLLGTFVPSACARQSIAPADASKTPAYRPADPLNNAAFDHFYNMDYDRSVQEFQKILDRHPDDPFAVNHLLTAVMFRELYRMGALNTGDYANDSFIGSPHRPADPKAKEQIKQLVDRAEKLEEDKLKANPKDVDALYTRGNTRAQFSTYTALVERAWFSALRNAVGARHDHERVLELSPNYTDAKLVVGAHNYVMGSLPWGVKVAVSLVGLSGSKEKGIEYLYEVTRANTENSIDAKIALLLFLRREHRYSEALPLLRGMIQQYPGNVLLALEEGTLLRSLNQPQEAAAVYRKVWDAGKAGKYPGLHYEVAAAYLGDLLRSQKDYYGAAAAYELVAQAPQPDPEILQKANLGAGEMYDLQQKRDLATRKYQAVIATNSSTPPADIARKHLREPFREN